MNTITYNTNRVHLINTLATTIVVSLVVMPLIVEAGFGGTMNEMIAGMMTISIMAVLNFIPMPDRVKAGIYTLLPVAVLFSLFLVAGYSLNKHYLLFTTIIMATLYFDKYILRLFSVFLLIGITGVYIVDSHSLLGAHNTKIYFFTVFVVYAGILGLLYLITRMVESISEETNKVSTVYDIVRETAVISTVTETKDTLQNNSAGMQQTSAQFEHIQQQLLHVLHI